MNALILLGLACVFCAVALIVLRAWLKPSNSERSKKSQATAAQVFGDLAAVTEVTAAVQVVETAVAAEHFAGALPANTFYAARPENQMGAI